MNVTTSNETRELNFDELNLVSGGGIFSFLLRVGGNPIAATLYEKLGGPDVTVGVKPAH